MKGWIGEGKERGELGQDDDDVGVQVGDGVIQRMLTFDDVIRGPMALL